MYVKCHYFRWLTELQEHYDNFFEDVFVECEDKYGPVEEMNVCDNLGDHLVGNVYVKFKKEDVSIASSCSYCPNRSPTTKLQVVHKKMSPPLNWV